MPLKYSCSSFSVRHCGNLPSVENGELVKQRSMYLKYQCSDYYTLDGPDTVQCYSNGQWSLQPVCRGTNTTASGLSVVDCVTNVKAPFLLFSSCSATFCRVVTEHYPDLVADGEKYVKDGERVILKCWKKPSWYTENYAVGDCKNTVITFAGCKYLC